MKETKLVMTDGHEMLDYGVSPEEKEVTVTNLVT